MHLSSLIPTLARIGSIAAVILVGLTVAWASLMVYPSAPSSDVSAVERLAFIEQNIHWQTISFVVALLMAASYLPLWAALAALVVPRRQTLGLIIAALGVLFSALFLVGYWTQFSTVRGLDQLRESNPSAAIALVEAFDFSGNFWSGSYGIVIAAFVLWGLTALMVTAGFTDAPYRGAQATGVLFAVAGLLAIVGAIGFAAGISLLEHGLLLSGIVSVVALSVTAFVLHQVATASGSRASDRSTHGSAEPVLQ